MFVKEFGQKLSSADLNEQLNKVYNWSLNLEAMTNQNVYSVLEDMKAKLKSIKESSKGHFAEKNPRYMEALMVSRILETLLDERFHSQAEERKRMKALESKTQKYAKGIMKFEENFKHRYGAKYMKAMEATAKMMARRKNVDEAMGVLRATLNGAGMVNESEFDAAKAVMAARDMVDSIQDMVEKLSKMMNEDLPALSDVMRSEVGQSQSDAFVSAATAAIQPMLDQAKTVRQSLDSAARAAAGEQVDTNAPMIPGPEAGAGAAPGAAPEMPAAAPEGGEDMATADTATGGSADLGRGKRF